MALGTGASGVVACASSGSAPAAAAPTTITGAELVSSISPAEIPAAREAAIESAAAPAEAAPAPAGKLVCRTTSAVDGTSELYLDWNGKVATGLLKRTAPSGMVYEQPVRAEKYQGTIIVDEPSCTDLATHAAMVVEQNGKLHMRVGPPGSAVTSCE